MLDSNVQTIVRSSGATFQMEGERLVKKQSPKLSRLERERTEIGTQVAVECGLFDVPEILAYNDAEGEITFRYDHSAVTLREYLGKQTRPELMTRVGRSLAAIHAACHESKGAEVRWHGDYATGNWLYSEARDRITIIDWSNASWTLVPPDRSSGSAGFDLGVALITLFHHRFLGPMYIPKPEVLGSALLQGYSREWGCFSMATVLPFISRLIHRRRQHRIEHRGALRNLAYDPSLIRLRLFLSRIDSRLQSSEQS